MWRERERERGRDRERGGEREGEREREKTQRDLVSLFLFAVELTVAAGGDDVTVCAQERRRGAWGGD